MGQRGRSTRTGRRKYSARKEAEDAIVAGKRGNGEGSYGVRPDGVHYGAITLDGKRRYFYGADRREVQDKVRAAQQQAAEGRLPETGPTPFAQWAEQVLTNGKLRQSTQPRYRQMIVLQAVPAFGHKRLGKVTASDVLDLYSQPRKAGVAGTSTELLHNVLHRCFRDAIRHRGVAYNVLESVDAPPRDRRYATCWGTLTCA